jgi:hypothetical protein
MLVLCSQVVHHIVTMEAVYNNPLMSSSKKTSYPTVIITRANDGSASDAVVEVDDIIFDATRSHAMQLCKESFDWICGKGGIGDIERAPRFERPHQTKKRDARAINW